MQLAEDLGVHSSFDSSVLTPEQRQVLSNKFLAALGDGSYFMVLCNIHEKVKSPKRKADDKGGGGGIGQIYWLRRIAVDTATETGPLQLLLGHIENARPTMAAILWWRQIAMPLCSEIVWPGTVTYLEAEKLRRTYIDSKDFIGRLRKLKPSIRQEF